MKAEANLWGVGSWLGKKMQGGKIGEKKNHTLLLCSRSPRLKALPIWQGEEALTLSKVIVLINKLGWTFHLVS